jgi:hypothetical protein
MVMKSIIYLKHVYSTRDSLLKLPCFESISPHPPRNEPNRNHGRQITVLVILNWHIWCQTTSLLILSGVPLILLFAVNWPRWQLNKPRHFKVDINTLCHLQALVYKFLGGLWSGIKGLVLVQRFPIWFFPHIPLPNMRLGGLTGLLTAILFAQGALSAVAPTAVATAITVIATDITKVVATSSTTNSTRLSSTTSTKLTSTSTTKLASSSTSTNKTSSATPTPTPDPTVILDGPRTTDIFASE